MPAPGTANDEQHKEEWYKQPRWRGSWRAEVAVRIAELEHRLNVVKQLRSRANVEMVEAVEFGREGALVAIELEGSGGEARGADAWSAHVHAVGTALHNANEALRVPPKLHHRLARWWTGSSVTIAWESVHDAEAELVELEPPDAMVASLPRLEAWLKEAVADKALRERYTKKLVAYMAGDEKPDSGEIRQAYQAATVANNDKHADARVFRNRLIVATSVLAALLFTMAVWHVFNTGFVSLCGKPPGKEQICYGGVDQSGRWAVFEVLLLGAVGGMLSVAFSLGRVRHAASRYSLRGPQTFLKPVAGAATGLLGVLLVLSGLLVSPANTSQEVLVSYAAVFGFAQHLLTRYVDKRADALIGDEEEKEQQNDREVNA